MDQTSLLRVLDAAANRASEGLRVVEDYVRFVLDDRHLTGLCKDLRHGLTAALARLDSAARLNARETQADVGRDVTLAAERDRPDFASVVTANLKRLQQALRSLEEYSKLIDPAIGAEMESLRYRSYTLERAVCITAGGLDRLSEPSVYVLLDGDLPPQRLEVLAASLIAAGVDVLQLREKNLDDRQLIERARLLRKLTHGSPTLLVINDRPDIALLCQADGVHLGQDDLSVKDARTVLGPAGLVGVSTHSIEQARQAVLDGASYVGVGPTFPSGTKSFDAFPGPDFLRQVQAEIRLPAFAIGGINLENVPEVVAAGFRRVALSGAICRANDPAAAVAAFKAALATGASIISRPAAE